MEIPLLSEIYESCVTTLLSSTDRTVLDIRAMASREDRMRYVYDLVDAHGLLMSPLFDLPPVKDVAISVDFRNDANAMYTSVQNLKSITNYNKAVAFAPTASSELGHAYANRSAVVQALGKPDQALQDISRAMEIGCAENITQRLIERRESCQNHARSDEAEHSELTRSIIFHPPLERHAEIPCASAKLDIAYNADCGRHIIANADILPGEVLAIEKEFSKFIEPKCLRHRCFHCFIDVYALLPCDTCNYAMFCSIQCRAAAWNEYHKYECRIMPFFSSEERDDLYNQDLIALRIVMKAKHEHRSWQGLRAFINEANKITDPVKKGFVNVGSNRLYDSRFYTSTYSLETNETKLDVKEFFSKTLRSVLFLHIIGNYTDIIDKRSWSELVDSDLTWFVGGLLLHTSMIIATNSFIIYRLGKADDDTSKMITVGHGLYPFLSLLKHGCNQNVAKVTVGSSAVLFALRSIKKGAELLDNYGWQYGKTDITARRSSLLNQYKFTCKCEACEKGWPTFSGCPSLAEQLTDYTLDSLNTKNLTHCLNNKYSHERTIRYITTHIYEKLLDLEKYEPCQELIKYCWELQNWWYYQSNDNLA